MNCREATEHLFDYAAGTLPDPERLRCDAHFAGCRCCRACLESYLKAMDLARAALGGITADAAPAELERRAKAVIAAYLHSLHDE